MTQSDSAVRFPSRLSVSGMYADYFIDYASYTILERAVPHLDDGLKPVQRRILHAMSRIDDGRFNKVATIVGDTSKYHPHGDASIGDAIVGLGQKALLIDTQGNWGNIMTGDPAAAARYIEARLTKFAKDILFSPKITTWQSSYDGRNKEPITFPAKFPLLLAQGAEGIAVGLSCKILPHNFNEIIDGCVASLRGLEFVLLPDFPTGGIMDASNYQDGQRGRGRVRVRARLEKISAKLIRIKELPFGITTEALIASIIKASESGKIKIAKIEDFTSSQVDILVHLPAGSDAEKAINALYAFTDCEVSISPNSTVILDQKPSFMGVSEMIAYAANRTKNILKTELEIQLSELNDTWHASSLERIFIEKRIYRDIEECTTWESVLETIDKGLIPYHSLLKRPVVHEDIIRLTEIKIKRISKYDEFKAEEAIKSLDEEIEQVEKNLNNLTKFTIRWFENLKKKYGNAFPRRTEISSFDAVDKVAVAATTETLYLDDEGFAGWGVKKGEALCKCSTLDDIIIITTDGKLRIVRMAEKFFAGKKLLYFAIYKRNEDPIFNLAYRLGKEGPLMAKRFRVGGITRDKEYDLLPTTSGSRIFHFSVHKSEEESSKVILNIHLKAALRLKNLVRSYDFSDIAIKGRAAKGNIITKHSVEKVVRTPKMQILESEDNIDKENLIQERDSSDDLQSQNKPITEGQDSSSSTINLVESDDASKDNSQDNNSKEQGLLF